MVALDKSKPYFHVHGDASGAAYEQGGKMFDGNGQQVDLPPADDDVEDGKAKGKKAKAKAAPVDAPADDSPDNCAADPDGATAAVDAQLAAQGAE